MKNNNKNTAAKIFWIAILAIVVVAVVLLGSVIKITNPLIWIGNIVLAAVVLIAGYILGKKSAESDDEEK